MKRTGCKNLPGNCIEHMSEQQILSLSGHKHMATFNGYAGNGDISKRKAMNKRDDILAPMMKRNNRIVVPEETVDVVLFMVVQMHEFDY